MMSTAGAVSAASGAAGFADNILSVLLYMMLSVFGPSELTADCYVKR